MTVAWDGAAELYEIQMPDHVVPVNGVNVSYSRERHAAGQESCVFEPQWS
jgi:hypothetical protein